MSSNSGLTANQLPISNDLPKEWAPQFMDLWMKRSSDAVNTKQSGLYSFSEVASFKQVMSLTAPWELRNAYRKCFDLVAFNGGPLAVGSTTTMPHGITGITQGLDIVAYVAIAGPYWFSYSGPNNLTITNTAVTLKNTFTVPFTSVFVVAEYLKT